MDQRKANPDHHKKDVFHKAGDKIERFGEKMIRNGNTKSGKMVYDVGNKIEHLRDKKP